MADQVSKNTEKQGEIIKVDKSPDKAGRGKEIEKASREFVEGVSEVVEGAEIAEFAEGDIGESVSEGKKAAPGKGMRSGYVQAERKEAPPTIEIMRIQISTQVENEIRTLEKEARHLSRRGKFNPAKLNGVVAKIRELRDVLANLAYVTAEVLKGWWMKYVKGITI